MCVFQLRARHLEIVHLNTLAYPVFVNANVTRKTTALMENVVRINCVSRYVTETAIAYLGNNVSAVTARLDVLPILVAKPMKYVSTTNAGKHRFKYEAISFIRIFVKCLLPGFRCGHGFIGGPEKCLDINECEEQPCHQSAECVNTHGSYRCICPQGTAGDPIGTGCLIPHQCTLNSDCHDSQACLQNNCTDPCAFVDCGSNTICSVIDHTAECQCQPGYIGDASGCFKVECLSNTDCPEDKYCNQEVNKCSSE